VRRGDLLAMIDKVPFQLVVGQRKAAVQEADANHKLVSDDLAAAQNRLTAATVALQQAGDGQKQVALTATDVVTAKQQAITEQAAAREAVDKASQSVASQEAIVAQAETALALAEWQLSQTEIRAPVDGTVNNLSVSVGDAASAGKALVGIVDAAGWRIVANYKENYIRNLQPGKSAWVWLDTHPWRLYRARIEGVSRGISRGPDQDGILPYVAPTTDWIRLRRRFPVTLKLVDPPSDLTLYMGSDASTLIFP
jgi:multidrug efflux system membrane fusion protein